MKTERIGPNLIAAVCYYATNEKDSALDKNHKRGLGCWTTIPSARASRGARWVGRRPTRVRKPPIA